METERQLLAVCTGLPRPLVREGKEVLSAIHKEPVVGSVLAGPLGVEGDGQADLSVHGGPDKAIYAYSFANTLHWRVALEMSDLGHGALGENLSFAGPGEGAALAEQEVRLGDVFRLGGALLEVSQPREPCFKLAMKLGLPRFPKQLIRSGRVGWYLRVIEPGAISAGDRAVREDRAAGAPTIFELNRVMHLERDDLDGVRRALACEALSPAWRAPLEKRLQGA